MKLIEPLEMIVTVEYSRRGFVSFLRKTPTRASDGKHIFMFMYMFMYPARGVCCCCCFIGCQTNHNNQPTGSIKTRKCGFRRFYFYVTLFVFPFFNLPTCLTHFKQRKIALHWLESGKVKRKIPFYYKHKFYKMVKYFQLIKNQEMYLSVFMVTHFAVCRTMVFQKLFLKSYFLSFH